MLQKIIFESLSPKSSESTSLSKKYFLQNFQKFSRQILSSKYSKFEYSYSLFCTNNLIFNEKCRIVARFKDYLVLDDSTEFLRRFYFKKELRARLKRIFNFYESYCKIFPNYMILPESQFLYRNIRKKQKMIDAFNEIKKEEEENRKHLKLGLSDDKKRNENVVFTKKIQESIERYHPSLSNILSNTFMSEINNNINNEFDYNSNDKSIITISLSSQRPINFNNDINKEISLFENKFITPNVGGESFTEKNFNDNSKYSQNSIFKIVQILNNNNKNNNTNAQYINNEENDNNIIKQNKKEIKVNNKNTSKKKNNNNNNNNNNIKYSAKKNLNINTNNNNNNQINNNTNLNTINALSKHNRVKTNLMNSNNKNKKQEINVNTKRKFISHKPNISVPLAANMLNNNNADNHNINNIIETDSNTIKIINNINNIIINEDKNKTINNGMIININNNYFQLKDSKHIKNNLIKRVKSKEDQPKTEKSKDKKRSKENALQKYKIFREKRTFTSYNAQNTSKKNKKFLINEIQSPNSKKDKYQNTEIKKKNINSKKYILTLNDIKSSNNTHIYRNLNYLSDNKKPNKKLIESKTLTTNPNEENHKNKKEKNITNNNNNIAITETNVKISNNNKGGNKLISLNKNMKNIPKLNGVESIDKKKLSINRKMVNNYLTSTQKKKTFQGRFLVHENSVSNTFSNKQINENNNNINTNDKIDFINICNTIESKNNPIKFKLNKKELLKKKAKTNSLQINDKNEFLSSFNLPKEKMHKKDLDLDIMNIEEKMVKYRKKSLKKLINNKTQTNSEAELGKDMNKNNPILNTITSKSIKKEKIMKKKQHTELNNKTNIEKDKADSTKEVKKLNAKEMKEKYHKLLRGNKFNHGSYDIANRIHLFKKFKGLNNIMGNMNMTSSINNTINVNKNKRSPLIKKSVLSPSERIQNTLSNFIKTPIKTRIEKKKENATIEVTNLGNKFKFIGKDNKHMDSNNKKMKFLKK